MLVGVHEEDLAKLGVREKQLIRVAGNVSIAEPHDHQVSVAGRDLIALVLRLKSDQITFPGLNELHVSILTPASFPGAFESEQRSQGAVQSRSGNDLILRVETMCQQHSTAPLEGVKNRGLPQDGPSQILLCQ